jgi:hypothetical protein
MADLHERRVAPIARKTDPESKPLDAANTVNVICEEFLSLRPLDDLAPPTKWKDFKRPLLRQFNKHEREISWRKLEGCGRDGVVFKAYFGKEGPFAIKIVRVSQNSCYIKINCA